MTRETLNTPIIPVIQDGKVSEVTGVQELEERLKRRYLDRLSLRVKRLRKLLIERNWEDLRIECGQLAASGETFGFNSLTHLAIMAQRSIPQGKVSRAITLSNAKEASETLISAIDQILAERQAGDSQHIASRP